MEIQAMPPRQEAFAVFAAVALLLLIVELVRRRRLRIEYAWLWLFTGAAIVILVLRYDWLVAITEIIGAVLPTTTLFLFALLFLMVVGIHFSVQISTITTQLKNLAQEIAILKQEAAAQRPPPASTDTSGAAPASSEATPHEE